MTQTTGKRTTIASVIEMQLRRGTLTAAEIVTNVKRVFPAAQTTVKSVYFYSSRLGLSLRKGAEADQRELGKLMAQLGGGAAKPRARRSRKAA